jgi:high-affinity K+ transport system ATPase subunit B
MPNLDPNVKRRNWIMLIVLVAVALAIYVSFMLKMRGDI